MLKRLLFFIGIIVPLLIVIKPVIEGNIPFWNDPARDLLLAWDNLGKPTLIGPTSGIPGIFYGPHWIWLLSIGVAVSKDPRVIILLILTFPYFIILPLCLVSLRKTLIDDKTVGAIWLLSIFAFASYASQIWSPNLAPVLFFLLLTFLYLTPVATKKISIRNFFIMGLILGLLLQNHISLGVVLTVSWIFYFFVLLITGLRKIKNTLVNTLSFGAGFLIMQLPFFAFEIRHGFMQMKSLLYTLGHKGAVVGQVGLTKPEILREFIERSAPFLFLPKIFSWAICVFLTFLIIKNLRKQGAYSQNDKNVLLFLVTVIAALFFVYFGTQNPVWDYHFIGVEIIFVFLVMLAMKKNKFVGIILFAWAVIVFTIHTGLFIQSFATRTYSSELRSKKETVEFILNDTKNIPFIYLAKNASIYTYDYDYLFRWAGQIENKHPVSNLQSAKNIYLIIPNELRSDRIGFTENRTPGSKYKTAGEWVGDDKTIVIKRIPL